MHKDMSAEHHVLLMYEINTIQVNNDFLQRLGIETRF